MTTKADLMEMVMCSANDDRIAEVLPVFINEVEARLNNRLRMRELLASSNVTIGGDGRGTLPPDLARVRFVMGADNPNDVLREIWLYDVLAKRHEGYAIDGNQIVVYPARNVTVHYWEKVPSLNDVHTNVVLERAIGLYHTGVMAAYEAWRGDPQKAAALWGAFDALLTSLNANEDWATQGRTAIM